MLVANSKNTVIRVLEKINYTAFQMCENYIYMYVGVSVKPA